MDSIPNICSIENCDKRVAGRGWCKLHWQRWRRTGDPNKVRQVKHGLSSRPEFFIWATMKARCYNPNTKRYSRYGGRGIKVCNRWLHSFPNFLEDMGSRPSSRYSIERKDNDKGYEPGNCIWATMKEQANNKSNNTRLTLNGETYTQREWSEIIGIGEKIISQRIKRGFTVEQALTFPKGHRRSDPSPPLLH